MRIVIAYYISTLIVICSYIMYFLLLNKNTIINLINLHVFISDALTYVSNVDVIYTDFAKAFDKINHQILFIKLKQIGMCGSFFILEYFFYSRSSINRSLQR